jgi:hypothetical protein
MRFLPLLVLLLLAVACDSEPPPAPVGVNDVKRACEIRAQWQRRGATTCTECIAIASSPPCDCPAFERPYKGTCAPHKDAKRTEPACEGVDACVFNCTDQNCSCVEACYANKDACRPPGAALDGCIAETCDPECR